MGDYNVAELQKIAIEYIDKKAHLSFEEGTALLNRISKTDPDPTNEIGIRVNVYTEPNASEGWIAEGGDYPQPDSDVSVNLAVKYKRVFKVGSITLDAKVQQDANLMFNPIKKSVSRCISGLKKIINGHMHVSDGTGTIATISANYSGGTPTVLTCGAARSTFGVQKLEKRKRVHVYDTTATTQRVGGVGAGALVVASRSGSARTATFVSNVPTDIVDTDIIVPENSVNNVMKGLQFIASASGTYFGQSRTANPTLQATEVDAASATGTISLLDAVFNTMLHKIGQDMDGSEEDDLELWWSPAQRQNYRNQGFALKAFMGGKNETLDLGFPRREETVSGYKTNVDVDGADDKIWYLRAGKLAMAQLMAPKVIDLGNGMLIPQTAASGQGYSSKFLYHLGYYGEFYSPEPYCQGVLKNLDVTNLPSGNI
jgi:hypothetical protein